MQHINEWRVLGPPGTGKTTYLANQIERAVAKHGSENVVVASFTKAAAAELNRRQLPIPRENLGTLHALCYRSLNSPEIAEINAKSFNEAYPQSEISVSGSGKMDELSADAVFATDGDKYLNAYNLQRAKCLPLELMNMRVINFAKQWESWKTLNNYIDFTDMITFTLSLGDPLPGDPKIGIYDEVQDFNKLELSLIRHWAKFQDQIILAGDDDQCHPAGTLISTANRGQVPIECLDPDQDILWNFDKHGLQLYRAKSFKVASRMFNGLMVTINGSLQTTYDHRCIAKWNHRAVGAKAVYLMRQGHRWRMGITDLVRKKAAGVFGVGQRARQEKADAAWVLSIHDDPIQAMMMEERLAIKYGISQMCFVAPTTGAPLRMSQAALDNYHDEIALSARPDALLSDLGFSDQYPMWVGDGRQRGKTAWQEIRAVNLFAEYMNVLEQGSDEIRDKKDMTSKVIESITKESRQCLVFSLDVRPYRTYVANGIIVHNCIYTFSGASPEAFLYPEVLPERKRVLKQSWRLPRRIHEFSQRWIKQVKHREPKEFEPKQEEGEVLTCNATFKTPIAAVDLAASYAQIGKTVMILTSCSFMLDPVKAQLKNYGLPFHNPYRKTRGDWNPMGNFGASAGTSKSQRISTRERVLAFLRDTTGTGYWSISDLDKWIELVKTTGILKRGSRDRVSVIAEEHNGCTGESDETFYMSIFEEFALERARKRDLPWFRNALLSTKANVVNYPLEVYKRHGIKALEEKPKIIVGTVHSVKGGESDVVILFPDISMSAMDGYSKEPDPIVRTFYVGMTRARETLVLCRPHSMLSVKISQ